MWALGTAMISPSISPQEQAVLGLASQRSLLRARDLAELALPTAVLSRLVAAGKLERVARGLYTLRGRVLVGDNYLDTHGGRIDSA